MPKKAVQILPSPIYPPNFFFMKYKIKKLFYISLIDFNHIFTLFKMSFKYTAIIIEPRKHKALCFVLNNMLECLSNEW